MRAITYSQFGPANEVLSLTEVPTPTPEPGEVLVRLETSGVNPSDTRARAGGRPGVTTPPFPVIIPHSDGAGVIAAVGEGVSPQRIGERVWIWNGQWQRAFGTAAEYIALPSNQAVILPDEIGFQVGATLGIPAVTACYTVLGGGPVSGKRILISGGAGSVGHIAVQIAVASGAEVIATASGDGIAAAQSAGAHHVLDYRADDLADQIQSATGGAPIDRAIEVEFGRNANTLATVMRENGTIVAYGSAKDMTPTMPFYPMMFKALTLEMALIYLLKPEARAATNSALTRLLQDGALNIRIDKTFPLDRCADAHDMVASGARDGAVILTL